MLTRSLSQAPLELGDITVASYVARIPAPTSCPVVFALTNTDYFGGVSAMTVSMIDKFPFALLNNHSEIYIEQDYLVRVGHESYGPR